MTMFMATNYSSLVDSRHMISGIYKPYITPPSLRPGEGSKSVRRPRISAGSCSGCADIFATFFVLPSRTRLVLALTLKVS